MLNKAVHARRRIILVWLVAGGAIFFSIGAQPQEPAPQAAKPSVKIEKVPVRQTGAVAGKGLYLDHCAVCHGTDGKGNGPAASALKTAPADLTLLVKNNGGKFPSAHVVNVLDSPGAAFHGSPEMPIWGPIFRKMGTDPNLGHLRAVNVSTYIESMQAK
jgi:mono/diheme cytochrome c family protein